MKHGVPRFAALFIAAGLVAPLRTWSDPAGAEFQVNTHTAGSQRRPSVAHLGAASFVVTWQSAGQDGSSEGIFGQRFDAEGLAPGAEFQVNTYTTGAQFEPQVSSGGSGSFVVVWTSYNQDVSLNGVFGQRFDGAGEPAGAEFQVNTTTWFYNQQAAGVAHDPPGEFVVVWESLYLGYDTMDYGVFGRRFGADGSRLCAGFPPVCDDFLANTQTTDYQTAPAIAKDAAGRFIVVWQSGRAAGAPQDGSGPGVFGQRFDSLGGRLNSEFQVNAYTTNYQTRPAVAAVPSGEFVIAWQSFEQDGSEYGIFARRFDAEGSALGPEFLVNSYTAGAQIDPSAAVDEAGNFMIVWSSFGQDGSGYGIFGRRFDAMGQALGAEFQVNEVAVSSQSRPAAAARGPGAFVVVWESAGLDGSGDAVAGRLFDCAPVPGDVTDLRVESVNAGAGLSFGWTDVGGGESYVLFRDGRPNGPFSSVAGQSASGAAGLTISTPPSTSFFLLAARNSSCGLGRKR